MLCVLRGPGSLRAASEGRIPNATVPKDEDRSCRRGNRRAEQSVRVLLPKSRFPRFRSPSHSFRRANGTRPARADLARGVVDEPVCEEPRTGPALCLGVRRLEWPDMRTKGRCPPRPIVSYYLFLPNPAT